MFKALGQNLCAYYTIAMYLLIFNCASVQCHSLENILQFQVIELHLFDANVVQLYQNLQRFTLKLMICNDLTAKAAQMQM